MHAAIWGCPPESLLWVIAIRLSAGGIRLSADAIRLLADTISRLTLGKGEKFDRKRVRDCVCSNFLGQKNGG